MRCKHYIFLAAALLSCVAQASTLAQESDTALDQRLELADTYMRASQVELAIDLLEQLREEAPGNILIRQELVRAYEALKRYDDALAVIAGTKPGDVGYDPVSRFSEMARLTILLGNEKAADSLWAAALTQGFGKENTYRTVYAATLGLRLLYRAVKVLEQGRHDTGRSSLFRMELAYLYGLIDNHDGSMKEYLGLLEENEQLVGFVRTRLARVLEQVGALTTYVSVTRNAVAEAPGRRSYREILGWLYLEAENYPEAYKEYQAADRLGDQDGRAIFDFAERVAEIGAYTVALAAYEEVLALKAGKNVAADALLGLARMHELWAETTAESAFDVRGNRQPAEHYDKAYQTLRAFLQRFPQDIRCADVLATLARLERDVYHRLEQASAILSEIVEQAPESPQGFRAQLEFGRIAILRNDLDQADASMQRLVDTAVVGEVAEEAQYELARVALYRGDVEKAQQLLRIPEESSTSDAANDALSLRTLILDHGGPDSTDAALAALGKTMLLRRQRRLSATIAAADSLLDTYGGHGIADDLRMLRATALHTAGRSEEARNAFLELALLHPISTHKLPSLLTAAAIQETDMQDPEGALRVYTDLLRMHSGALHAPEIRRRILAIRSSGVYE